jgi:sugar (pentulose or hexulose) kinase
MSLLGVDVGTTGCKAVAFNLEGQPLATAYRGYPRLYPQPGWVEIDPVLFLGAVDEVIRACAAETVDDPIQAIGFSALGGVLAVVDRAGQPLCNIMGSTDSRAAEEVAWWREQMPPAQTYAITGTPLLPNTQLFRIVWVRNHWPEIFGDTWKFMTAIDLVTTHLGADPAVDRAMASSTMMFDLKQLDWSDVILETAGLSRDLLSPVVAAGEVIGQIRADLGSLRGMSSHACLVSGGHDQQVCSLGAGLTREGMATDSLGTAECITTAFRQPRFDLELLKNNYSNLCHVYDEMFVCLAYNFSCGDLVRWYLHNFESQPVPPSAEAFDKAFASLPEGPSDVLVLPHFQGSGTPTLDLASRGAIVGLRMDTDKWDIFKGLIDSQNYEMRLNLDIWRQHGISVDRIRCYGGGARHQQSLQLKADILEIEVAALSTIEVGCFGAAALAGVGYGAIDIDNVEDWIENNVREEAVFVPRYHLATAYREKFAIYRDLYDALRPIHARCP